jgi:hypothetical protein
MGRPRGTGNRADKILELHRKGLRATVIAARLGLKNSDYVNQVLRAFQAQHERELRESVRHGPGSS